MYQTFGCYPGQRVEEPGYVGSPYIKYEVRPVTAPISWIDTDVDFDHKLATYGIEPAKDVNGTGVGKIVIDALREGSFSIMGISGNRSSKVVVYIKNDYLFRVDSPSIHTSPLDFPLDYYGNPYGDMDNKEKQNTVEYVISPGSTAKIRIKKTNDGQANAMENYYYNKGLEVRILDAISTPDSGLRGIGKIKFRALKEFPADGIPVTFELLMTNGEPMAGEEGEFVKTIRVYSQYPLSEGRLVPVLQDIDAPRGYNEYKNKMNDAEYNLPDYGNNEDNRKEALAKSLKIKRPTGAMYHAGLYLQHNNNITSQTNDLGGKSYIHDTYEVDISDGEQYYILLDKVNPDAAVNIVNIECKKNEISLGSGDKIIDNAPFGNSNNNILDGRGLTVEKVDLEKDRLALKVSGGKDLIVYPYFGSDYKLSVRLESQKPNNKEPLNRKEYYQVSDQYIYSDDGPINNNIYTGEVSFDGGGSSIINGWYESIHGENGIAWDLVNGTQGLVYDKNEARDKGKLNILIGLNPNYVVVPYSVEKINSSSRWYLSDTGNGIMGHDDWFVYIRPGNEPLYIFDMTRGLYFIEKFLDNDPQIEPQPIIVPKEGAMWNNENASIYNLYGTPSPSVSCVIPVIFRKYKWDWGKAASTRWNLTGNENNIGFSKINLTDTNNPTIEIDRFYYNENDPSFSTNSGYMAFNPKDKGFNNKYWLPRGRAPKESEFNVEDDRGINKETRINRYNSIIYLENKYLYNFITGYVYKLEDYEYGNKNKNIITIDQEETGRITIKPINGDGYGLIRSNYYKDHDIPNDIDGEHAEIKIYMGKYDYEPWKDSIKILKNFPYVITKTGKDANITNKVLFPLIDVTSEKRNGAFPVDRYRYASNNQGELVYAPYTAYKEIQLLKNEYQSYTINITYTSPSDLTTTRILTIILKYTIYADHYKDRDRQKGIWEKTEKVELENFFPRYFDNIKDSLGNGTLEEDENGCIRIYKNPS